MRRWPKSGWQSRLRSRADPVTGSFADKQKTSRILVCDAGLIVYSECDLLQLTAAQSRSRMSNINGKVYAMNAITPMKPWKTIVVKAFFFLLRLVKPLQKDLINLSFIEFARWVVIPRSRFPYVGHGQVRDEMKYDYLLFFSNFNGTWNQYIDAFADVLGSKLNLIWRWSEK